MDTVSYALTQFTSCCADWETCSPSTASGHARHVLFSHRFSFQDDMAQTRKKSTQPSKKKGRATGKVAKRSQPSRKSSVRVLPSDILATNTASMSPHPANVDHDSVQIMNTDQVTNLSVMNDMMKNMANCIQQVSAMLNKASQEPSPAPPPSLAHPDHLTPNHLSPAAQASQTTTPNSNIQPETDPLGEYSPPFPSLSPTPQAPLMAHGPTSTYTPMAARHGEVRDSAGTTCGQNVPLAIKQKIWTHKYIEWSTLLGDKKHQSPEIYTVQLQLDPLKGTPLLHQVPNYPTASTNTTKSVLSNDPWLDFTRFWKKFIAVYIEKYPDQIHDLLSYELKLAGLNALGGDWKYYDRNFRQDREFNVVSFLTHRSDLYSIATATLRAPKSTQPFRAGTPGQKSASTYIPPGYCFAYHTKGQRCEAAQCPYKHTCNKCSKSHPAFLCGKITSKEQKQSSTKQPTSDTSKRPKVQ